MGSPSVSMLNSGTGSRENGLNVFKAMILSILEFFGTEWSLESWNDTADMMHHDYHWLHMAEIKQFAAKAKKGEYNVKFSEAIYDRSEEKPRYLRTEEFDGKIYGKLTPATLMKWIERYGAESLAARSDMRIEKKSEERPAEGNYIDPSRIGAAILEVLKNTGGIPDVQNEQDAEILRQEKIKQRQRDTIMRHDENNAA